MKDNPPARIWKGGKAYEAWVASTFAPTAVPDRALAYVGALDVVAQRVKEKEEKEEHRREPRVGFLQFCKHRDRRHVQE